MKTLLLLAACYSLLLSSCTYQQKLARAERKIERLANRFPELKRIDTLTIRDTLPGAVIELPPVFLDTSTARLDSVLHLLDSLMAECDSLAPRPSSLVIPIYRTKPCLTQPYVFNDTLFAFTLHEVEGRLVPVLELKPRYFELQVPCPPAVTVQPCPDCWIRALRWWEIMLLCLGLAAVVMIAIKMGRK